MDFFRHLTKSYFGHAGAFPEAKSQKPEARNPQSIGSQMRNLSSAWMELMPLMACHLKLVFPHSCPPFFHLVHCGHFVSGPSPRPGDPSYIPFALLDAFSILPFFPQSILSITSDKLTE